jgi:hypothetical protein
LLASIVVSIGVRTGAVHTMAPRQWARLPTVIIAAVPIGAGVFAIVGTDPTLQGELQVAVGCFRIRPLRLCDSCKAAETGH